MAERKTPDEKIQDIEKKLEQLKAQKREIEARLKKEERAARTRRLIQNGALAEKYFDCEGISPEAFEKLLQQIIAVPGFENIKG